MELRLKRSCVLALLVMACCTSILAVEFGERRAQRGGSGERQSSQQQIERVRLPRRLSSRHNELASTESSKRSSQHMLLGGHLRTEPAESTTTEMPSSSDSRQSTDSTLEDGLLLSSAGGGKDRKASTSSAADDDDKKTLAQQVKEGKYGLIPDLLFPKGSKRLGILSYSPNSEVPRDTRKSLGGLDEDEIWLAENHLLVLKGASLRHSDDETPSELHSSDASWPPIDDYNAPRRQVKIPPRPRVPPPFPVQLIDGGPVQLIGTNGTSFAAENDTIDFEALPGGFRGFLPGEGPYFALPGNSSEPQPEKRTKAEGSLGGPFYPALPPGAVIVPPPSNQTDYDEDQSIYYPPPYSFVYPQNNSTDIPPGPLVPGIILPPPPDFFSSFDDLQKPKDKYAVPSKRPVSSSSSTTTTPLPPPAPAVVSRPSSFLPPRKSSTKHYKTASVTSLPPGSKTASYSPKPFSRAKVKNASTAFQRYRGAEKTTAAPPTYQTLPFIEVTTPLPVKSSTLESPERFHVQPILNNQVTETSSSSSTEKPWKSLVSSKAVPLLTYYASTTPSSVDQPVETTPLAVKNIGLTTTEAPAARYPSQASYYFYEEANNEEPPASSTPAPLLFLSTTAETPPYYKLDIAEQPGPAEEEKKDYYDQFQIIPPRPQTSSKDYNVKLIDSIVKDPQIYKYIDSGATSNQEKFESSPIRSQSPRMLHSEPLYYQPVPTRSSPRLTYYTTAKPKSYYDRPKIGAENLFESGKGGKSKPIYQYSFEATNFKRNHQPEIHEPASIYEAEPPQIPTPRRQKEVSLFNEYQDIQNVAGGDQYNDYEGSEPVADQRLRTVDSQQHQQQQQQQQQQQLRSASYLTSKKKERAYYPQSTTAVPIRATTLAGHQQYFTKQDEQLLDDVTKEYFTMFGKKLSGRLPSTTPIYGKSSVTQRPQPLVYNANSYDNPAPPPPRPPPSHFHASNIRVHYGDATPGPYSLQDDVLLNYKQPLPSINPDAEFISVVTPSPASQIHNRYRAPGAPARPAAVSHVREYSPPFVTARPPISLEGDVAVNYKPQRPPVNPDAEFISPVAAADKPNSYFAYRLPGDGGHFYFLTPQAIGRQEPSSYLYSRPSRASRPLPRRRRARDGD